MPPTRSCAGAPSLPGVGDGAHGTSAPSAYPGTGCPSPSRRADCPIPSRGGGRTARVRCPGSRHLTPFTRGGPTGICSTLTLRGGGILTRADRGSASGLLVIVSPGNAPRPRRSRSGRTHSRRTRPRQGRALTARGRTLFWRACGFHAARSAGGSIGATERPTRRGESHSPFKTRHIADTTYTMQALSAHNARTDATRRWGWKQVAVCGRIRSDPS